MMGKKKASTPSWRQKTIEQLENTDYGNPAEAPTGMVRRCIGLCKVPIGEFKPDDLQLMISQQIALQFLIPLAIEHLRENLLQEARFYPGDLLEAVLRAEAAFWQQHPPLYAEVASLLKDKRDMLNSNGIVTVSFDSIF